MGADQGTLSRLQTESPNDLALQNTVQIMCRKQETPGVAEQFLGFLLRAFRSLAVGWDVTGAIGDRLGCGSRFEISPHPSSVRGFFVRRESMN
jgi:hypothetical protein